jgi:hypothetical protein
VRRRRKSNEGRLTGHRIHEAARAPQPGPLNPPQKTVYRVDDLQSIGNRGLDIN